MIYIVEIPHQRPPKCWTAHTGEQIIEAINADAMRSGEICDTIADAIKYNGADLSSQIFCGTDDCALASLNDDGLWLRHGGAAAREALRDKMIRHGLVEAVTMNI